MNTLLAFMKEVTSQISFIESLNVFEKTYYLSQFEKGEAPQYDELIQHYYQHGWRTGKNPCRWFDSDFYLIKYKDIQTAQINPFFHYLKHGFEEGRLPNPSISDRILNRITDLDDKAYSLSLLSRHQDVIDSKETQVDDSDIAVTASINNFLEKGQIKASKDFLHPYFHKKWYASFYDVPESKAIVHFNEVGRSIGLVPCKVLIDYAQQQNTNNWFEEFTLFQSRLPFINYKQLTDIQKCYEINMSGLFDSEWYASEYLSLRRDENALVHFSLFGIHEDKNPNRFFNQKWYRHQYSIKKGDIPLIHYLQKDKSRPSISQSVLTTQEYATRRLDIIEVAIPSFVFNVQANLSKVMNKATPSRDSSEHNTVHQPQSFVLSNNFKKRVILNQDEFETVNIVQHKSRYQAQNTNPYFIYDKNLTTIDPGLYLISFRIHFDLAYVDEVSKVYVNYGDGFSEENRFLLPLRQGYNERVIYFSKPVIAIRYNPLENKSTFELCDLALSKFYEAKLHNYFHTYFLLSDIDYLKSVKSISDLSLLELYNKYDRYISNT